MSEAPAPPQPGATLWGDDLNAYLLSLEARIASNETRFDAQTDQIADLQQRTTDLEQQVVELEARPEYVYESHPWQYSKAAPPPTGSQVRFDNTDLSLATVAVFRLIDSDGADRTQIFRNLNVGSQIRISDWDNVDHLHRFHVTAAPTVDITDATVPVTWISGSGTIPSTGSAKANVAFLVALTL